MVVRASLAAFVLVLTGCQRSEGDDRICSTPAPRLTPGSTAQQQFDVATNCVHHWSYRLARAEGDIRDIAEGVVGGACGDAIQMYEGLDAKDRNVPNDTGRSMEFFRREALFRVTQGRAGRCALP